MKKKRKYKSPQIIVMDYEMEESCLEVSGTAPNVPGEEETKQHIPILQYDSDYEWN